MATSSAIDNEPVSSASAARVDMKFEVIVIPSRMLIALARRRNYATCDCASLGKLLR